MEAVNPDFQKLIDDLIGEKDAVERILNSVKEGTTFRINPLKTSEKEAVSLLEEEGFKVEPISDIPYAYISRYEPFQLGKSLSHYLGNIYIQDLSSMIPPIVLDPKEGELVLDMAAAPGSKTTQLVSLMNNRGLIVANDPSLKRIKFLAFNLMRIGSVNSVVTIFQGNRFGRLYFETFDKVLVDPPCSALGTIKASPEVLKWWRMKKSEKFTRLQWDLVVSGIKALKPGGILVYSTCTIVPDENEAIIDKALKQYPVRLEEINVRWKRIKVREGIKEFHGEKYSPDMVKTLRLYPHENIGEGFFIAKLRKIDTMKRPLDVPEMKFLPLVDKGHHSIKDMIRALEDHFGIPEEFFEGFLFEVAKEIRIFSHEASKLPFLSYSHRGLPIAKPGRIPPILTTWGAQFLGRIAKRNFINLEDVSELLVYLKKESLSVEKNRKGQQIVLYKGHPIGYGIASDGKLKSRAKIKMELLWPFCLEKH